MADLELQHHRQYEFSLEALSDKGSDFLTFQAMGPDYAFEDHTVNIGEKIHFPHNIQDMIVHEAQDEGLVINF